MESDPAGATVRWQRNRNQGFKSLIAVRERVDALWQRVNFPAIDGSATVACGTLGEGER